MPSVIIPPTDVSPNTGTGSEVLSNSPALLTPTLSVGADTSALTDLLINPTTKTSGNLIDAQVNGTSRFSVTNVGVAKLNHATQPEFQWLIAGTRKAYLFSNGINLQVGSDVGGITFSPSNALALTLDSSKNATFNGRATISSGATTSAATDLLINPTTKASGNLIDAQVNGSSKASFDYNGRLTLTDTGGTTAGGILFGTETYIYRASATDLTFGRSTTGHLPLYFWSASDGNRGFFTGTGTNGSGIWLNSTTVNIRVNGNDRFQLASTGALTLSATTASTSTTTGALVVSGGVGIAGKIYTGDTIVAGGSSGGFLTINRTTLSGAYLIYSQNGELGFYDQGSAANKLTVAATSGNVSVLSTTASTSTTTGALVVSGGVGVAGAAYFGGAIAIGNTVNTVSPTSPNRTITMVIGGTTYYIAAKTTND